MKTALVICLMLLVLVTGLPLVAGMAGMPACPSCSAPDAPVAVAMCLAIVAFAIFSVSLVSQRLRSRSQALRLLLVVADLERPPRAA